MENYRKRERKMARKENENEKPHRKKINIKWKREKV
jgi:hypothetical protein